MSAELPSPETMLTYASILEKQQYVVKKGVKFPIATGEIYGAGEALDQIVGHLGAALVQSSSADDQIIMDHVRVAHELAKTIRRRA